MLIMIYISVLFLVGIGAFCAGMLKNIHERQIITNVLLLDIKHNTTKENEV